MNETNEPTSEPVSEPVGESTSEPVSESTSEPVVIVTKKDPNRVEQGKRLAAISREAKERKMREKIEAELKPGLKQYIFPAIATLSTFSFFYVWFSREKPVVELKVEPKVEIEPKRKKFESLG